MGESSAEGSGGQAHCAGPVGLRLSWGGEGAQWGTEKKQASDVAF